MDTPQRRGIKDESRAEIRGRERVAKLSAIARLRGNPDFYVLKDFLIAAIKSHTQLFQNVIVSSKDQADHNFHVGVVKGLELALRGEEIIESVETPTPAT